MPDPWTPNCCQHSVFAVVIIVCKYFRTAIHLVVLSFLFFLGFIFSRFCSCSLVKRSVFFCQWKSWHEIYIIIIFYCLLVFWKIFNRGGSGSEAKENQQFSLPTKPPVGTNVWYFVWQIYNVSFVAIYCSDISTNSKFNSIITSIIQNIHNKKCERFVIAFFVTHFTH